MSKRKDFFGNMWDRIFGGTDEHVTAPSAPPPWDPWELNPEFFAAMSRWTIDHPESTLDRILERLCTAIESGQSLLELIPDRPFPARSLIQGITRLLQLGRVREFGCCFLCSSELKNFYQIISQANNEVHQFARRIIHWTSEMKAAFEDGRLDRGGFTEKTRRNLTERRCVRWYYTNRVTSTELFVCH